MSDLTFKLPWANVDLDIHADPPNGWDRVAVVALCPPSMKKVRERWPHAAVIGPLRTVRGIDLLVRGLLANPQIRVLVMVGKDVVEGEPTVQALHLLWRDMGTNALKDDVAACGGVDDILNHVCLVDPANVIGSTHEMAWAKATGKNGSCDRPGGPIILPPPPPEPTTRAPHGDPGERIAGDTLTDVWPRALDRILTCGREIPTHYGLTRELAGLVTVIRDPTVTINTFRHHEVEAGIACANKIGPEAFVTERTSFTCVPHPILGFSWNRLESYTKELTTDYKPDGAVYSYGSRMAGDAVVPDQWHSIPKRPDQFNAADTLLSSSPLSRAVYLTPWNVTADSGKESGRPCMVSVQFRARSPKLRRIVVAQIPVKAAVTIEVSDDGEGWVVLVDGDVAGDDEGSIVYIERDGAEEARRTRELWRHDDIYTLDLFVTYRSHSYLDDYPLNLAACCLWLVRMAEKHSMAVGTVMCVSNSAHLYSRDFADAQKVIAAAGKGPVVRWDARSVWRVERIVETYCPRCARYAEWESEGYEARNTDFIGLPDHAGCEHEPSFRGRERVSLRATALDPTGADIIDVFEAPTPGKLLLDISRSGLLQDHSHSLWLGAEVMKVWGGK